MKVVGLAIVITFIVYTEGWVATSPKHSNYKGNATCFMDDHDLGEFKSGETKRYKDECIIATCELTGKLTITGCGSESVDPPCYITDGDLSLSYPECCSRIICPKN